MDKAKKKQSAQVASCKPDDTQTENDECTQPENSDGGDTEDVRSSDDSQSCSSASSLQPQYCPHLRMMRAIKVFLDCIYYLPDLKQSPHFLENKGMDTQNSTKIFQ